MKTKIIVTILVACMAISGCGSTEKAETEVVTQTQEENESKSAEANDTETDVVEEESDVVTEEKLESEELTETDVAEEPEEVVEKTYERKDFTMNYVVTNFDPSETIYHYSLNSKDEYSSNDYLSTDIMAELESRGYNIDDFVITYEVALNAEGNWLGSKETVPFHSFEGIEDEYVKLFPVFIKYGEIDDSKLVYNFTLIDEKDSSMLDYNPDYNDPKAAETWYEIFNCIQKMREDETYVEIDFEIPDTIYLRNLVNAMRPNIEEDENIAVKDFTLNEWYNGMLYALFVEQSIDLDGYFDNQSIMY